jgi:hypothetical protein
MRSHRSSAAGLVLGLVSGFVGAGHAMALDLPFADLKIGLRGGANYSILNNPPGTGDLYEYNSPTQADPDRVLDYIPYTNYYGAGWNAGAALNVRFIDIIGLEVGYQYARESVRGTIEVADVQDCRFAPANPCYRQEVEQRISHTAHHVPIVLQASLPLGVARPFISLGLDIVVSRTDRSYEVNARSPLPEERRAGDEIDQGIADQWDVSPRGQNVMRAGLNPDTRDFYGGFIAGVGVNLALKKIEIPIEFRAILYPATGGSITQRGEFGDVCISEQREAGLCGNPLDQPAPAYNDVWTAQVFVLFGLDFLIF